MIFFFKDGNNGMYVVLWYFDNFLKGIIGLKHDIGIYKIRLRWTM